VGDHGEQQDRRHEQELLQLIQWGPNGELGWCGRTGKVARGGTRVKALSFLDMAPMCQ